MPEALAELQRWMLGGLVAAPPAAEEVRARIAGGGRLEPEARLAIYRGGYRSRLLDTLREDYPALRLLVGETVFDLFAQGYVAAHRPRHFSLYEYGAGFAGHLEATRPEGGGPLAALPAALARLERARAEAQRAEGVERLPASPAPAGAAFVPGLRMRLPGSVRLLRLEFDLLPLIEACESGGGAVVPEAGQCLIAVARNGYRVRQHRLEPWQYCWLEALGAEGAEAYAAAARAARLSGRDCGALLADLILWLPAAEALGLAAPA
jgi:hypothetical protein